MVNKKSITEHGLFWLRDNEQRKLWGTLYIDELNKARLETHGSLIEETLGLEPTENLRHTIVGQVGLGQKYVTLIGCDLANTEYQLHPPLQEGETDWSRQTWRATVVVHGIGFDKGEEIAFEQADLSISTLPKWAPPNQVKLELKGKTKSLRPNLSTEDRADETTMVSFGGQELLISLRFCPTLNTDGERGAKGYLIKEHCRLAIERPDGSNMPLESIFSVAGALLDLLSICCNETPAVTSLRVRLKKDDRHPANVYFRTMGDDIERKERSPSQILELQDLGGMKVVVRWLEVRERYGAPVRMLAAKWYNDKAYFEDNFSRMYTAVEGLLARRNKRQRANMTSNQLAEFVDEYIPDFSSVTGRSSVEWAEKAKVTRDKQIDHIDPASTLVSDGRKIYVMANVLYVAGAIFLLKEMGMESQVRKYIEACQETLLLM